MSVLQLALKHLDELSHGTRLGTVPWDTPNLETHGTVGTRGTAGTDDRRCSVCGQSARFGYGVRLLHGEGGRWFCAAHRPEQATPEGGISK
jgi:hypothetical protein